eukprot:scaffold1439_cov404-Prasinococcus_capsulatus_cf.AAC.31
MKVKALMRDKNRPGGCNEPFHQELCSKDVVNRKITMSQQEIEAFLAEAQREGERVALLIALTEQNFGPGYYNSTYEQLMAADYLSDHLVRALQLTPKDVQRAKENYARRFPEKARYKVACFLHEEIENFDQVLAAFERSQPHNAHLLKASKYPGCQTSG